MTPNPNCPGVPHRPDDPLYRAAVERHIDLSGLVQWREWSADAWSLAFHRFVSTTELPCNWKDGECRPVEPLRTDGYPDGMPDPGEGWRLLMKGEEVRDSDEVLFDGASCVGRWSAIDGNKWIQRVNCAAVRRRITEDHDAIR